MFVLLGFFPLEAAGMGKRALAPCICGKVFCAMLSKLVAYDVFMHYFKTCL